MAKKRKPTVVQGKDDTTFVILGQGPSRRSLAAALAMGRGGSGAGSHRSRGREEAKGRARRPKHGGKAGFIDRDNPAGKALKWQRIPSGEAHPYYRSPPEGRPAVYTTDYDFRIGKWRVWRHLTVSGRMAAEEIGKASTPAKAKAIAQAHCAGAPKARANVGAEALRKATAELDRKERLDAERWLEGKLTRASRAQYEEHLAAGGSQRTFRVDAAALPKSLLAAAEALRRGDMAAFRKAKDAAYFDRVNPRLRPVPTNLRKTPRAHAVSASAIGVRGRWPIGDLFHARLAVIYAMSPVHAAVRSRVLAAVKQRYPGYAWDEFAQRRHLAAA